MPSPTCSNLDFKKAGPVPFVALAAFVVLSNILYTAISAASSTCNRTPSKKKRFHFSRSAMATSISFPSKSEILSLYRSLLRTARTFSDYNIREYAKRRTIDGFCENRQLSDPSSIASAFSNGKSQLEVAKRQSIVYSLYAPKSKSVMEIKSK
ncbi:LYR motif-containing protein 4-like protein [Cinnamomum micranthum f. kanehirae]|uniref:LYR motif-containing protein 4-like protein n=1 Tax=Cinnamomum micranthum f. kanehirae TaxID=337451 RepID=A0A443NWL8_9MAGN|nr:LYR motif-containing protein 4-like protein [Cinnamomum micranthum f. kanehirae]